MPKVGKGSAKKEFAYTDAGKEAAKDYAKESGQEVSYFGGGILDARNRSQNLNFNTMYQGGGEVEQTVFEKNQAERDRIAAANEKAAKEHRERKNKRKKIKFDLGDRKWSEMSSKEKRKARLKRRLKKLEGVPDKKSTYKGVDINKSYEGLKGWDKKEKPKPKVKPKLTSPSKPPVGDKILKDKKKVAPKPKPKVDKATGKKTKPKKELKNMPFGSEERKDEYKRRDWAMDETTHPKAKPKSILRPKKELKDMPFYSQERIDEYKRRNWAMDETTHK
jgi:hypothetical protein